MSFAANQITDASPLGVLTDLRSVTVEGPNENEANPLTDIGFVSSLGNLQFLGIEGYLGDKAPLGGKQTLEILGVGIGDSESDSTVLATLTGLRQLNVGAANLLGLSFLSEMTNLETLRLYSATQVDWLSLPPLPSLRLMEAA